jgi:hypothetical protein
MSRLGSRGVGLDGEALSATWGVAHLIATANVAAGFGSNQRRQSGIITMEWIAERALLVFARALVTLVAAHHTAAARAARAWAVRPWSHPGRRRTVKLRSCRSERSGDGRGTHRRGYRWI